MKILDRYIIKSIIKVGIVAILVFALILVAVELFGRMDNIMTGSIPFKSILEYAVLSVPQYLMMVSSLAFLFATTYFLSMLSANNERIALLNAGLGKKRLALPIIILALIISILAIGAKEKIINPLIAKHETLGQELFGLSSSNDTRNIVLKDDNGYLVYTRRFISSEKVILDPVIVKTENGEIKSRIEGDEGTYEGGFWTITNAKCYNMDETGVTIATLPSLTLQDLNLEPEFFQSENLNIETMSFRAASSYLKKLKNTSPQAWQERCTDWLRSVFSPLSIFVLMTVAATMSYSMKKNVLLFSIIESLCIAVVYYVSDMVFSIAAHQGTIQPIFSVLLPVIITLIINFIIDRLGRII